MGTLNDKREAGFFQLVYRRTLSVVWAPVGGSFPCAPVGKARLPGPLFLFWFFITGRIMWSSYIRTQNDGGLTIRHLNGLSVSEQTYTARTWSLTLHWANCTLSFSGEKYSIFGGLDKRFPDFGCEKSDSMIHRGPCVLSESVVRMSWIVTFLPIEHFFGSDR